MSINLGKPLILMSHTETDMMMHDYHSFTGSPSGGPGNPKAHSLSEGRARRKLITRNTASTVSKLIVSVVKSAGAGDDKQPENSRVNHSQFQSFWHECCNRLQVAR